MSTPLSRAIQLVNSGETFSLIEWNQVAKACQTALERVGPRDEAVDSAVAVGRIIPQSDGAALLDLHPLAVEVLDTAGANVAGHVRGTLAMVTHAARRGRLPAHVDTMLAGVEARALSPAAEPTEISAMLAKWPNTLAAMQGAGAFHPAVAMAISHVQAELLQQSIRQLDLVVAARGGLLDVERFRGQLQASCDAWQATRRDLKEQWPGGFSPDQVRVARTVSVLSVELRDCVRTQTLVGPAERFEVLTRSEQAGNLQIAAMIAPVVADMRVREELLGAAATLQMATSTILSNTRGDLVVGRDPTPAAAAASPGPAVVVAPGPAAPVLAMPAADDIQLSGEATVELARRRDAGVVAAAALDGVPAAAALADGASPAELAGLVDDGRRACGQLMASVLRLIAWRLRRRGMGNDEECFASIVADVAVAAHNWDPTRSSWSSYVVNKTDWGLAAYWRDTYRQPIPVSMDSEEDRFQFGALNPALLADPGPTPEETVTAGADAARAAWLVSRFAYPRSVILQGALGTDGAEPASATQIAARLEMPVSTVRYHLRQGMASLRSQMEAGRDD